MAPDDGTDARPPEDEERSRREADFSRRQLLRAGSTTLPVVLSGGWLAACGSSHNDAHGDHTDAPHSDAAHTDTHGDGGSHNDHGHSDTGGTHNDTTTTKHTDTGTHSDTPTHSDAPKPPHTDVTTPHADLITPIGVHVDQPATHMDVN